MTFVSSRTSLEPSGRMNRHYAGHGSKLSICGGISEELGVIGTTNASSVFLVFPFEFDLEISNIDACIRTIHKRRDWSPRRKKY